MSLCASCKSEGIQTNATRVLNGVGWCEACWRNREEEPTDSVQKPLGGIAKTERGEQQNSTFRRNLAIDWKKVKQERDSGVSVAELATKYGTSIPSVYARTKTPMAKTLAKNKSIAATPKRLDLERMYKEDAKVGTNGLQGFFTKKELRLTVVALFDAASRMASIELQVHKERAEEFASLAGKLDKIYTETFARNKP